MVLRRRGNTVTELSSLRNGVVPLNSFSLPPNLPSSTSAAVPRSWSGLPFPFLAHGQVFLFLHCPFGPLLFNGFVFRNHGYQWIQWSPSRHTFQNYIVLPVTTDCLPKVIFFSSHGTSPDNQGNWKPKGDKTPRTGRTQIYRDKYTKYDIGFVHWKIWKL